MPKLHEPPKRVQFEIFFKNHGVALDIKAQQSRMIIYLLYT